MIGRVLLSRPALLIYAGLVVGLVGWWVVDEIQDGRQAQRDLKAAERAREITVDALVDRETKQKEDAERSSRALNEVSKHEDRPISPVLRAYLDGLH